MVEKAIDGLQQPVERLGDVGLLDLRTRRGSGEFRVRRWVGDYDGVDEVTARASRSRDGNTCQATVRLKGS